MGYDLINKKIMTDIKLGIKISIRDFNLIPDIYSHKDLINFIEITLIPDFKLENIDFIKNLRMPYAIHLPNSNDGIDFGDINRNSYNIKYINKLNQFKEELEELNPICYIIHPESSDINLSITNIKKMKIRPIAIENMPFKSLLGGNLIGYNPLSLTKYFEQINNLEFCFDINHAIKAAISMNIEYISFIKNFLTFKKPILFHIAGGNLNIEVDEHTPLYEGQYNLIEIKKILLDQFKVINLTLETPRNKERGIKEDLRNMKYFKNLKLV